VVGATAYFFAVTRADSLVVLLLTAYGIIAQLAPPIVASMYWRRATTAGAIAGLLAGSATALFFYFQPALRPFDLHEGVIGLLVHVPVLVAVSLGTAPQPQAHSEVFVSGGRSVSVTRSSHES
jgi:SSS family solute:Na+ symporter